MGRPPVYSKEEKQLALEIWRTKGVSAAAREIGCTTKTIYDWVDKEGLRGTQNHQEIYEHKLGKLKFKLMERVYFLLGAMTSPTEGVVSYQGDITKYIMDLPSAQDQKNLAIAVSIILDRISLMEGQPTSRVEQIDVNTMEKELTDLANELANRAKGVEQQELPSETEMMKKLRDMEDNTNTGETKE